MDRVKNSFTIKNLEHLSGIKAHTIRIWEKRYNLFEPERTDTNIRMYDLENLQKLSNAQEIFDMCEELKSGLRRLSVELKRRVLLN